MDGPECASFPFLALFVELRSEVVSRLEPVALSFFAATCRANYASYQLDVLSLEGTLEHIVRDKEGRLVRLLDFLRPAILTVPGANVLLLEKSLKNSSIPALDWVRSIFSNENITELFLASYDLDKGVRLGTLPPLSIDWLKTSIKGDTQYPDFEDRWLSPISINSAQPLLISHLLANNRFVFVEEDVSAFNLSGLLRRVDAGALRSLLGLDPFLKYLQRFPQIIDEAAENSVHVCKLLHEFNFMFNSKAYGNAAVAVDVETFEYLERLGVAYDHSVAIAVVKHKGTEIKNGPSLKDLQFFEEKGLLSLTMSTIFDAARIGRVDLLKWIVERDSFDDMDSYVLSESFKRALAVAIGEDHQEVVEYLISINAHNSFDVWSGMLAQRPGLYKYLAVIPEVEDLPLFIEDEDRSLSSLLSECIWHGNRRLFDWIIRRIPDALAACKPLFSGLDRSAYALPWFKRIVTEKIDSRKY